MATVLRRPRSPFWFAYFTDDKGRRRQRSTKERQHGAATAVAERWQREADVLAADPSSALKLKNPSDLMEQYITLTQKATAGKLTHDDAKGFVSDLLVASDQDPLRTDTVQGFLTTFVSNKEKSRASGTALRYDRIIKDFIEFLGKRAAMPLANLSTRDVRGFQDKIANEISNSAANMAVKVLRGPLNAACRQGIFTTNPAAGIDMLPFDAATRRAFTMEELRHLLRTADDDWKGMILVGYYCGFRIQDAASLQWRHIDLERKIVAFRPGKEKRHQKANKTQTVILPELREWLSAKQGLGSSPLFPTLYGKRSGGKYGLSLTFRALMVRAGINFENVASEGADRAFYNLGYHSLRHSNVTHAANAGISEEMRREHVGHDSDVHRDYTHIEIQAIERAFAPMPRILPKAAVSKK
jgi:integrase